MRGSMDIVERCRTNVDAFCRITWDVDSVVALGEGRGLNIVTTRISEWDVKHVRIDLSDEAGLRWTLRMVGRKINCLLTVLKEDPDTYLLDNETYEAKLNDFAQAYRLLESTIRTILGQEEFAGPYGTPGFHQHFSSNYLTSWKLPQGHLLLSYEEHKRGDPLAIALVATPHPARREEPATASPPS
jgi:hypothetical protein